jgi:uncharacterized protein YdhG (YjbR/CyaY superfamily)
MASRCEVSDMARIEIKSVDGYIAGQPAAVQPILERVRGTILEAVPRAEETISYKIPTYKLPGGAVLYFAAWKLHYSLYPATKRVLAEFHDELKAFEVRASTIRFSFSEPVPVKLIGRIAKFRMKEAAERDKTRAAAPEKLRVRNSSRTAHGFHSQSSR